MSPNNVPAPVIARGIFLYVKTSTRWDIRSAHIRIPDNAPTELPDGILSFCQFCRVSVHGESDGNFSQRSLFVNTIVCLSKEFFAEVCKSFLSFVCNQLLQSVSVSFILVSMMSFRLCCLVHRPRILRSSNRQPCYRQKVTTTRRSKHFIEEFIFVVPVEYFVEGTETDQRRRDVTPDDGLNRNCRQPRHTVCLIPCFS